MDGRTFWLGKRVLVFQTRRGFRPGAPVEAALLKKEGGREQTVKRWRFQVAGSGRACVPGLKDPGRATGVGGRSSKDHVEGRGRTGPPVRPSVASVRFTARHPVVLPLDLPRSLEVRLRGVDSLRVRAAELEPATLGQALSWVGQRATEWTSAGSARGWRDFTVDRFRKVKGRSSSPINLSKVLPAGKPGMALVALDGPAMKGASGRVGDSAVVVATDIGLSVRYSWDGGVVWASSVHSGKSRRGVRMTLSTMAGVILHEGYTGREGLMRLPGLRALKHRGPYLLVAEHRGDTSFMVLDGRSHDGTFVPGYGSVGKMPRKCYVEGKLLADAETYRAGGRIHLAGSLWRRCWDRTDRLLRPLRSRSGLLTAELVHLDTGRTAVFQKIAVQSANLFAASVGLPADLPPGPYQLWVGPSTTRPNRRVSATISVESNQPRLSVRLRSSPSGPSAVVKLVGNLDVGAEALTVHYQWVARKRIGDEPWSRQSPARLIKEGTVCLDSGNQARVRLGRSRFQKRSGWTHVLKVQLHLPSGLVIQGLGKLASPRQARPCVVEAPRRVAMGKRFNTWVRMLDRRGDHGPAAGLWIRSAGGSELWPCFTIWPWTPAACNLKLGRVGPNKLEVVSIGPKGRQVVLGTALVTVLPGGVRRPGPGPGGKKPAGRVVRLSLEAEQKVTRPGETAVFRVRVAGGGRFPSAADMEGLLTLHREGVWVSRKIRFATRDPRVEVPVTGWLSPAVRVHLVLTGPRWVGSGQTRLKVEAPERRYKVTLNLDRRVLSPGSIQCFNVAVNSISGRGVRCRIAAVVTSGSPRPVGGRKRSERSAWLDLRFHLPGSGRAGFAHPVSTGPGIPVLGGRETESKAVSSLNGEEIRLLTLETDERGRASACFVSPRRSGTYGLGVVAAPKHLTGHAETATAGFSVTEPLRLRLTGPKAVAAKDLVCLKLKVDNPSERTARVGLGVRVRHVSTVYGLPAHVLLPGRASTRLRLCGTIEGNGPWPGRFVQNGPGRKHRPPARVTVRACLGRSCQQAFWKAPVQSVEPVTTTSVPLASTASLGVRIVPRERLTGLSVGFAATPMLHLAEGLRSVVIGGLRDLEGLTAAVLTLSNVGWLAPQTCPQEMAHAFNTNDPRLALQMATSNLLSRLGPDGAFQTDSTASHAGPLLGFLAAHSVLTAKGEGIPVDRDAYRRMTGWLRRTYSEWVRRFPAQKRAVDHLAGAAWVLSEMGHDPGTGFQQVLRRGLGSGLLSQAQLLMAAYRQEASTEVLDLHLAALEKQVGRIKGVPGGFERTVGLAVALMVLDEALPGHELADAVLKKLLARRSNGVWETALATSVAVWSLSRHWLMNPGPVPAYRARLFVGNQAVAEQNFVGRTRRIVRHHQVGPVPGMGRTGRFATATLDLSGRGKVYQLVRLFHRMGRAGTGCPAGKHALLQRRVRAAGTGSKRWSDVTASVGQRVNGRLTLAVFRTLSRPCVTEQLPGGLVLERLGGVGNGFVFQPLKPGKVVRTSGSFTVCFGDLAPGVYELVYTGRAEHVGRFTTPPALLKTWADRPVACAPPWKLTVR